MKRHRMNGGGRIGQSRKMGTVQSMLHAKQQVLIGNLMPLRQVGRIFCDYIIRYSIAVQVYCIIFAESKSYIMPSNESKSIKKLITKKKICKRASIEAANNDRI